MASRHKKKTPEEKKIESLKKTAKSLNKKSKKEMESFYEKHILSSEDALTIVLKSHLFVEHLIDEIVTAAFPHPEKILKRKFSDKINLLEALGVGDSKYKILRKTRALNSIRNNFAHDLNYRLTTKDLEPLVENIRKKGTNIVKLQSAFFGMVGYLQAIRDIGKTFPFLSACFRGDKLYRKDKYYDIRKLIKGCGKELDSFFEALEIHDSAN